MKKQSSKTSESSTNAETPHSPLRVHSPGSDLGDPPETTPYESPENSPERRTEYSKAIVAIDKFTLHSSVRSPSEQQKTTETVPPAKPPSSVVVFNRAAREEPLSSSAAKVGPTTGGVGRGGDGVRDGRSRPPPPATTTTPSGWAKREEMIRKLPSIFGAVAGSTNYN